MNVLYWILGITGGIIAVLLLIGGIVFWRGWIYAVRHRDDMVLKRIELDKMLADNRRIIESVERLEREMDNGKGKENN